MGRPESGNLGSFDSDIVAKIKKMRKAHQGWGAMTILIELKKDSRYCTRKLPSVSSIASLLKAEGFTKKYEPHNRLPVPPCFLPSKAHELWQIDGQGNEEVGGVGIVSMLNVKDVFSHKYVSTFPARMKVRTSHPTTRHYQTALRLGFTESGRPEKVQTDHASVFYDNKSKSPFPTILHLWLISLDISLCFSRVHQPTDQGQVEKSHQTIEAQAMKGQLFRDWKHFFEFVQFRRSRLNFDIPSSSTSKEPPLEACPQAIHSKRWYRPETELNLICLKRVWTFLEKGKWFRIVSSAKTISLGGQVYYLSKALPKSQIEITFLKKGEFLVFRDDKELVLDSLPIKGISKEKLMGNLFQYFSIPNFQLQLPFDWEVQEVATTFLDNS